MVDETAPTFLPVNPQNIPQDLREGRWAVWVSTPRRDANNELKRREDGTPVYNKLPHNGTTVISTTAPEDWLTFDQAAQLYLGTGGRFHGITKLVEPGEFVYIDIDSKQLTDTDWRDRVIGFWPSYMERSPSGAGLRAVYRGTHLGDRTEPFEVYGGTNARHLTFTGQVVNGHNALQASADVDQWIGSFPEKGRAIKFERVTHPPLDPIPPALPPHLQALNLHLVPHDQDRSKMFARTCQQLFRGGLTADQVFQWAVGTDWLPQYAMQHRENSETRAVQFLWDEASRSYDYFQRHHVQLPEELKQPLLQAPQPAQAQQAQRVYDFLLPVDPAPQQPAIEGQLMPAARPEIQPQNNVRQATLDALVHDIQFLEYGQDMTPILMRTLDLTESDTTTILREISARTTVSVGDLKRDRAALKAQVRQQQAANPQQAPSFYREYVWVESLGRFYHRATGEFTTTQGFSFTWGHIDEECLQRARDGSVERVSRIDFAPGLPQIFTIGDEIDQRHSNKICNTWNGLKSQGAPGDVSWWLNHFTKMGFTKEQRDFEIQRMAFILRHPERKINYATIWCGPEGGGKNFLLYPLAMALGEGMGKGNHCAIVEGEDMAKSFNGYIEGAKVVIFNEANADNHFDAGRMAERLKRLTASPPDTLTVERKGVDAYTVRNLLCVYVTSNSKRPFDLQDGSRRAYALWLPYSPKDSITGQTLPEERAYWADLFPWMKGEGRFAGQVPGWEHVVHYLLNSPDIDLSNFDPAAPPPVTDFTRQMIDASRSGVAGLLTHAIESGMLPEVVTSAQVRNLLVANASVMTDFGFKLDSPPSVRQISKALGQISRVSGPYRRYLPDGWEAYRTMAATSGRDMNLYVTTGERGLPADGGQDLIDRWGKGLAGG